MDSHIARLQELEPKFAELLEADPFTARRSLQCGRGSLSEDDFFQHWHCKESDDYKLMVDAFNAKINSPSSINQLIFMYGHGGSGKSTFLRYLARTQSSYRFEFIDFHRPAADGDARGPIEERLRHELMSVDDDVFSEIVGLLRAKPVDAEMFFGDKILAFLDGARDFSVPAHRRTLLSLFNLQRLLYGLLLYQFRVHDPERLSVVVFDNLDGVGVDYLTQDVQRGLVELIEFGHDLLSLDQLAELRTRFSRSFRLVLALRDKNYEALDTHLSDSLGHNYTAMSFRLASATYAGMVDRRLEIGRQLYDSERTLTDGTRCASWHQHCRGNRPLVKTAERLMQQLAGDEFSARVLIPLFNNNLKRTVASLLDCLDDANKLRLVENEDQQKQFENDELYRYGVRGGLLKTLLSRNLKFLTQYKTYVVDGKYEQSYCLHHRVLLTVLDNLSGARVDLGGSRPLDIEGDDCDLWSMVRELHQVYPVQEILRTVGECFDIKQTKWSNLLVVRNKNLASDPHFDDELNLLKEYGVDVEEVMDDDSQLRALNRRIQDRLKAIRIQLNPAGFVYVRYVLTHFEFYSAIAEQVPGTWNDRGIYCLFQCGLLLNDRGKFVFEDYAREAMTVVARHIDLMSRFYDDVYRNKLGLSPDRFLMSRLAFKHEGQHDQRRPRGRFHAYRLLTTHIGYLEKFRQYVLRLPAEAYSSGRNVGRNEAANSRLCELIAEYIVLLESVPGKHAKRDAQEFRGRLEEAKENKQATIELLVRRGRRATR